MDYKKLVQSVHYEQNKVRTNPKSLIPALEDMLKFFDGTLFRKPGKIPLRTNEGPSAVKELIEFLKNVKPIGELTLNEDMSKACQDHANDIGPQGKVSHNGSDGSSFSKRLERYGEWGGTVGENCEFGGDSGLEVVINLLVDDGVTSRGHRENIFNPEFKVVGIGCGPHRAYDHCTVLDYAARYGPKGSKAQNSGASNFSMPSDFGGFSNSGFQQQQPTYTTTTFSSNPSNGFSNDPFKQYSFSSQNQNPTSYTPQYTSYTTNQNPTQSTYTTNTYNTQYTDPFTTKTTYTTGPSGNETTQTTTYKSFGDTSVLNDPFIAQHLGKVKSTTDFSSTNLRDVAQKEAPPGAIGWSVNSEVEIKNGRKISKVVTTYKFADGSTREVTKEIMESI